MSASLCQFRVINYLLTFFFKVYLFSVHHWYVPCFINFHAAATTVWLFSVTNERSSTQQLEWTISYTATWRRERSATQQLEWTISYTAMWRRTIIYTASWMNDQLHRDVTNERSATQQIVTLFECWAVSWEKLWWCFEDNRQMYSWTFILYLILIIPGFTWKLLSACLHLSSTCHHIFKQRLTLSRLPTHTDSFHLQNDSYASRHA